MRRAVESEGMSPLSCPGSDACGLQKSQLSSLQDGGLSSTSSNSNSLYFEMGG